MQNYVVYHAGCVDGFGAAFAAWKKFKDDAIYIPLNHYDSVPNFPSGSNIYCIDFCFKAQDILSIIKTCHLTILDHHVSEMMAVQELIQANHPNLSINFDLKKSGAVIAWEFWHTQPVPDYFYHIQDRDLGKYELEHTKEIISVLMLYPKEFSQWENLTVDKLLQEGAIFSRLQEQIMKETLERHHFALISGHWVPVVNSTCFWSDITFLLQDLYPQAPFVAAYYSIDGDRTKWSLRSKEKTGKDVSKISAEYGGGGHTHSGGFTSEQGQIQFRRNRLVA